MSAPGNEGPKFTYKPRLHFVDWDDIEGYKWDQTEFQKCAEENAKKTSDSDVDWNTIIKNDSSLSCPTKGCERSDLEFVEKPPCVSCKRCGHCFEIPTRVFGVYESSLT